MAEAARKQAVVKHKCEKPRKGQYAYPCHTCFPDYYRAHSGIRWYVLVIRGGVEIEQHGPFEMEYDLDRSARSRFKDLKEDQDSMFWLKLKEGRAITGEFPAGFFEKEGS